MEYNHLIPCLHSVSTEKVTGQTFLSQKDGSECVPEIKKSCLTYFTDTSHPNLWSFLYEFYILLVTYSFK